MVPSECLDAENCEIFWQSNMRVIWKGGVTYRYVQAAPLYLSRAKKKLKCKLVLRASSSEILLSQGHLLLILVNDFVRGRLAWIFPIRQVSLKGYTCPTRKTSCPRLPDGIFLCPVEDTKLLHTL